MPSTSHWTRPTTESRAAAGRRSGLLGERHGDPGQRVSPRIPHTSRGPGRLISVNDVAAQSASLDRPGSRDRNSIPILTVRLGPARDFLIALAVLAAVLGMAATIAFFLFG